MSQKEQKSLAPINTKVEAVRRFFADSKAYNHPIKEHPVSNQEEYVRDLYLEMLCVMAQYESSNTEKAFILIKRIMAACEDTQPLHEYIKRSMEISPDRTAEFIKQCKDNELCEIFMLDSMLLSCANGDPNAKQVAFLTQFGDMLGFERGQMEDISKFALAILAHDSVGYQVLLQDKTHAVQVAALCYAKQFVSGKIVESSMAVSYNSTQRKDDSWLEKDVDLTIDGKDTVVIENLTFENNTVILESIKEAVFRNCTFKNYSNKISILTRTIDQLKIIDCTFENCKLECDKLSGSYWGVVFLDKCGEAEFESTLFLNCSLTCSNDYYFSLIYPSEITGDGIWITNCEFKKITTYNGSRWPQQTRTIVAKSGANSVVNSRFFDCTDRYGLFSSIGTNKDNQVTNCSSFISN